MFGLFIATPETMLAALGLGVIRADEIQRLTLLAEQRAQVTRLANAALSTALERETDKARQRASIPSSTAADDQAVPFDLEPDRTVVFRAQRLSVPRAGLIAPAWLASERRASAREPLS